MDRIGIIGLGRMGSAMAARFVAQGVAASGWTRSGITNARATDLGITGMPELSALVAASDILILSLFDDDAVSQVLDALLLLDISGRLIVETSTVSPSCLKDRIAPIEAAGAMAVDAPVSGGPEMVTAGQCGVFIGGSDEAATRAIAALAPMTERSVHIGPLGAGLVMKIINNSMLQTYVAGLNDMLRLAKRAGLPLETALRVLCGGPAGVPMIAARIPKILGEDTEVGFDIASALKDVLVFQRVAQEFGIETPTLAAAEIMERDAVARGMAELDVATMFSDAYENA